MDRGVRTLAIAALVIAAGGGMARRARAQVVADSIADSTLHVRGLRNPTTAVVLGSMIPGAGFMYAGHWRRGILTYEGAVGAAGLGTLILIASDCSLQRSARCNKTELRTEQAMGVAGIVAGAWVWANGAIQARRTVERDDADKIANASARVASMSPTIGVPFAPGDPWRVGVRATW